MEIHPAFIQLLSLGFLWVSLHCAPMCGPIVGGLQLTRETKGDWWLALMIYQLGRALIYVSLGAGAAAFYSEVEFNFKWAGWFIVFFLLLLSLSKFGFLKTKFEAPKFIFNIFSSTTKMFSGLPRVFVLGIIMAFLPCMLSIWALGLAAQTADPVAGGITMLLLIGMTSVPLGLVIWGGDFLRKFKHLRLEAWLLLFSAAWCSLMTLADSGYISHFHISFKIYANRYILMFW